MQVIRGNYDPLPEHFSEELRDVIGLMLCKTVKKRPEVRRYMGIHATTHMLVHSCASGLASTHPQIPMPHPHMEENSLLSNLLHMDLHAHVNLHR